MEKEREEVDFMTNITTARAKRQRKLVELKINTRIIKETLQDHNYTMKTRFSNFFPTKGNFPRHKLAVFFTSSCRN